MAARRRAAGEGTWTYLYAIVSGLGDEDLGPIGLYESEVYTVDDGNNIAAVVSDVPKTDRLRPERRHLAAHQGVLSRVTEESSVVLPVSFGTIADGRDEVRRLLSHYHDELLREVQRVEGRVEMELHVSLDVPNVFEYFIKNHPELREARDRVYDSKHEPTQDEKIDLGQLFERFLSEDRERFTGMVEKVLSPHCAEIKRNKLRNEQEVMRLACLMEKGKKAEFESAVNEAAEQFDDNFAFEYTGPFPPYNFIQVHLKI